MRTLIVVTVFLFVSFTFSYPLKPLDERSTELTWQAWLLVDDQNQTKQSDEGGNMKKKVIAKSVFIVPTFSPEKCGEGTVPSKNSGRCVQVIQVDPDMQLQFLFSKLQSHLENSQKTSSGPEKFTIEIPQNDGSNDDTSASFVLSPSSKSKDEKDPNNNMAVETTTLTTETSNTETTTTDQVVTTVLNYESEDAEDTTDVTESVYDEETTLTTVTTVTTMTAAETTVPTTEDYRQAIFFRLPTPQESE